MKKLFIVPVLLVFTVAGGLYYFVSKQIMSNKGEVQSAFVAGNSSNDYIIDVRDFAEYKEGHISGAINIPLSQIRDFDVAKLGEKQRILVYCQTGSRADLAVTILKQRGFRNVTSLGSLDSAKSKFNKVCSGEKVDC